MVFIADREADQFQILYDCHNRGHSFVIRSKHDRIIQGEDHYLSWHLNKKKVLWDIEINLPKEKTTVTATMKFGEITINDTNIMTNKHIARHEVRDVGFGVIEVKEKEKREGKEQLKWVLFTNLELNTKEDALKVVKYYRLRRQIKNYFKVLKDGCCHVEHSNLQSFEKLEKYTMCFSYKMASSPEQFTDAPNIERHNGSYLLSDLQINHFLLPLKERLQSAFCYKSQNKVQH